MAGVITFGAMAQTRINLSHQQWLVLISSFLVNGLGMGFFYAFGQWFVAIQNTFNSTTAETVVVQSVTTVVLHVTGMLNGALTHKYGPRTVGIFGTALNTIGFVSSFWATSIWFLAGMVGIFVATGISALMVSCSVATSEHFRDTSIPLALSFVSSGTSVGGMAYPYLIQYLSDTFALRGSLLLIGAILLHSLPCALLWSPPEKSNTMSIEVLNVTNSQEIENRKISNGYSEVKDYGALSSTSLKAKLIRNDKVNNLRLLHKDKATENTIANSCTTKDSLRAVLNDKVFVTFCLASGLSFSGLSVFLIFIVDLFLDKGFSEYDAALALLLMNVLNLIGRFLPGILMRLPRVTALSIPILASLLGAILMTAIVFALQLNLLLFLSTVFGFVLGIIASTFTVTTAKLVDVPNFSNAFGVLVTVIGIGSSPVGPINGVIRDKTGSYDLPFVLSSSAIFIAFLLYSMAQCWRTKLRNRINIYSPIQNDCNQNISAKSYEKVHCVETT